MHKIVFQPGLDGLGIEFLLPLRFIDPDQLLSLSRVFTEAVIGDAIKPGRKLRFAAKTPDVLVSANECLLGEIVRQGEIGPRELT